MKRLTALTSVLAGFLLAGAVCPCEGQALQVRSWIEFVPFQTPVDLALWDPAEDAVTLGYQFQILLPPKNGVLMGEGPVRTYIPNAGFYGIDVVQFVVLDPLGNFDTGTVRLIVVPGLELVERPVPYPFGLGLSFRGAIFATGLPPVTALGPGTATVFVKTRLGEQETSWGWGSAGLTSLSTRVRFEIAVAGGPRAALPVTAALTFDPSIPGLSLATVQITAPLGDIRLGSSVIFNAVAPPSSTVTFSTQAALGGLTFEGNTRWRFIPIEFSKLELRMVGPATAWGCPGCPLRVEGGAAFEKATGFTNLWWIVRDLPLPCPSCEVFRAFLDARVEFTPTVKRVVPSLRLEANWSACLRPYVEVLSPAGSFGWGGLDIYGVEIKCDFPGGWGFRSASSFVEGRNGAVTGDERFFEVWQLYGPVPSCCGPQGRWQVSNFFQRAASNLFGWGLSEIQLHLFLDQQFSVRFVARFGEVDPADPSKTWSLRIELSGLLGG